MQEIREDRAKEDVCFLETRRKILWREENEKLRDGVLATIDNFEKEMGGYYDRAHGRRL